MDFIQLNLNHCAAAQDLLSQIICEQQTDVAIICEQYKNLDKNIWECDSSSRAAVWACGNKAIEEGTKQPKEGFARVKIGGIYIYSCYMSPNIPLSDFEKLIDNLVMDVADHNPVVIGGDFNAWARDWGCRKTNERGKILLDALSRLDVVLANNGVTYTFRRADAGSVVDLTFVSTSLARDIEWQVSEQYTHSDHQAIIFKIKTAGPVRVPREMTKSKGWAKDKFDPEAFTESFSSQQVELGSVNNMTNQIRAALKHACDASMPLKRANSRRKENYWWNNTIAALRKKCCRTRRQYQRSRSRPNHLEMREEYYQARKDFKNAINQSKSDSFKKLCKEADSNPWGNAYRIVMSRLKGKKSPQITCPCLIDKIVKVLFPEGEPYTDVITTLPRHEIDVTEEEIVRMCSKIGDKKAPGLDEIPNNALKHAMKQRPTLFIELFKKCLMEGTFPDVWKKQRLILLPKPGKVLGDPASYRPICLLDTIGKCLERIIHTRLLEAVERVNGLSERQFGFRKERSTIDAINYVVEAAKQAINGKGKNRKYCAIITLDVKNAFNSAGWKHIISSLRQANVPEYLIRIISDYFANRSLLVETDDGIKTYKVTSGVPQGSVLGPLLWNIMYNGIFDLQLPEEATVVGFADDIALLIRARFLDEVQLYANEAISTIKKWLTAMDLSLADHKTELVLISGRKKRETLSIQVGESSINSVQAIKYLGVMVDDRLKFKNHVEYACDKAAGVTNALSRLMPNVGGPRQSQRLLISRVTNSVILYGAPIWEGSLRNSSKKEMLSIFRRNCLRVCSGYRTISAEAASVVAGIAPIDILAKEQANVYKQRANNDETSRNRLRDIEKERTMVNWQSRWENSPKGRWTYRLIPCIKTWVNRKHGEVNYNITQFLTGHGGYRSYLYRFGHDSSPRCPQCTQEDESVEHVTFKCPRFDIPRARLMLHIGEDVTVDNIISKIIKSDENWDAFNTFLAAVHKMLRDSERIRKASQTLVEPGDA